MTREDDVFVSLDGRADLANQSDGDLFVSLHCDYVEKQSHPYYELKENVQLSCSFGLIRRVKVVVEKTLERESCECNQERMGAGLGGLGIIGKRSYKRGVLLKNRQFAERGNMMGFWYLLLLLVGIGLIIVGAMKKGVSAAVKAVILLFVIGILLIVASIVLLMPGSSDVIAGLLKLE